MDEHDGLLPDLMVIPYFRADLWEGKVEVGFIEHDDEAAFHEIFTAFIDKVKGAGYKVVKIDWDGLEDWL